ncbi:MAG TPA: cytochrome P450 [Solirubrobacterales bacterium]|nr:cytochrome P450 [Solirubrobacterales bacterium]
MGVLILGLPPGPSAPKLVQTTRWMRSPVKLMEDCRERYGETFVLRMSRVGELVFVSDPPSVKRLFSADRENRLPEGRTVLLEPVLGRRSLLLLEGDDHLRSRRLMLPPFHGERMRAYEAVMGEAAERELDSWPVGERFALHPRMQAITLEVILRAVFGVEDPARRERLRTLLVRLLDVTSSPTAQVVGLASRRLGRIGPYRRLMRVMEEADGALFEQIAERRADPEVGERDDILSMLVAARFQDGGQMDDAEVRDQLMTLLLAGHETTATALAWAFDLLFRRPDAMERLRAEIAEGHDAYLDAVATETLRVRPVVPSVGRLLTAEAKLGGYELPAGTAVMPSIYLVHTRDDLYDDPYEFRPERFLDGAPDTYSWIPFGGGTRRCLGAAFASFEMKVVLRTILRRAELRPGTDRPEPYGHRNVTLSPRNGTPALLDGRRPRHAAASREDEPAKVAG